MNHKLATAATAVAVALGSFVGLSGVADAAEANGIIKRTTTSYTSPSTASIPVHTPLAANEEVDVICFAEGQVIEGNPYWFRVEEGGERGFVHRDAIVPPAGLGHC